MEFLAESAKPVLQFTRLTPAVHDLLPRGGASLVSSEKHGLVLFGGADRGQGHFNDTALLSRKRRYWRKRETNGDIPTPRSGHAAVCYGKYMLLFGGIDFTEEAAYNDSYVLDLETLVWKYVGEAGAEIPARNSHSLAIIRNNEGVNYIVIFGGASPELGTLGETYYAILPDASTIESTDFFLTWQVLQTSSCPEAREMHSTCVTPYGSMIVAGGRNEKGEVLSDVWELCVDKSGPLVWSKRHDLTLDVPRCAHGAAVLCPKPYKDMLFCVIGGFTGLSGAQGMPDGLRYISLSSGHVDDEDRPSPPSTSRWSADQGSKTVGPRFGVSVCNATSWISSTHLTTPPSSPTKEDDQRESFDGSSLLGTTVSTELQEEIALPTSGAVGSEEGNGFNGLLVFGGVNIDRDFADVWLVGL